MCKFNNAEKAEFYRTVAKYAKKEKLSCEAEIAKFKDVKWNIDTYKYVNDHATNAPRSLVVAYGEAARRLEQVQSTLKSLIETIYYL